MFLCQPCPVCAPLHAPAAPYNPSSLLSIFCIPAWGPSAGCHPSPSPSMSLPSSPLPPSSLRTHPGRGPSSALHSSKRSRLALRGTLGFTNCVRPRDTSVINTNRHMRRNNNTTATQRLAWLMLSICEIWNKLTLWYDPKYEYLWKRNLRVKSTEGSKCNSCSICFYNERKLNTDELLCN